MIKSLCYINSSLDGGGSERVMTHLANESARRGIRTTMILVRERKDEVYPVDPRVRVIRLTYSVKNKAAIALRRFLLLRRHFRRFRYDQVISFMVDINILTILAALGTRQKITVSERADPGQRIHQHWQRRLENILYRRAERVVIQTEQVRDYFSDAVRKKCVVIPNPVDQNLPQPFVGMRDHRIVSVGRLNPQKNYLLLLRAFQNFLKDYPDFRLEIYGEGALREELMTYSKELGVEDSVDWKGFQKNIHERILSAHIFVSTSDYEGISNAILEAMAMGIPSIATDCPVGGSAMLMESGMKGILVRMNDEKELVDAMKKIASDREFAANLGNNATGVREKYAIENIADQWFEQFM